jgi:tetratricopeptide (TPR) repeat protein
VFLRSLLFFLILWSLVVSSFGASREVPKEVAEVQDALYRLEFDRAEESCNKMMTRDPRDPTGYGFLSIVKWNLLLQAAANITLDDYSTPTPFTKEKTYKPIEKESQEFHQITDKLIALCEDLIQKNPDDIKALYFLGLANENLSSEQLAVLKSRGRGIHYGKKAMEIHRDVIKRDPEFVDAKLSIATGEFASATLPWTLKWIAFLLGYRGDKEEALAKLEDVAEHGVYRRLDARVVLALLEAWKGDPNRAVQILTDLGKQYPMNYLIQINRAAIFENRLENRKDALAVYNDLLEDIDVMEKRGLMRGEVHYRIGRTYYGLREYSKALEAFESAINSKVSEAETVPLSHYYIARINEEQGDKQQALEHFRLVLKYSGPEVVLKDELKVARKKTRDS